MDANSPTSGQPDSPVGRYVILPSPDDMTAIERVRVSSSWEDSWTHVCHKRVADVIHYGFYLKDNSPPGIYLVADPEGDQSHIVAGDGEHVRDGSGGSESVTAVETFSSATSEVGLFQLEHRTQQWLILHQPRALLKFLTPSSHPKSKP